MMKEKEKLASAFPAQTPLFDAAVDRALEQIHREADENHYRPPVCRRTGWIVAFALMLFGVLGVAEGIQRGVFDFLISQNQPLPQAADLVQNDLCALALGTTTLQVREAVYDGQKVRLVLSIQNKQIRRMAYEAECYGAGEFGAALLSDGVTALNGFDWFTIDGTRYDMTGGSGGENAVGEKEGEILCYFELVLGVSDDGNIIPAPQNDFVLGIPVGSQADEPAETFLLHIPIQMMEPELLHDLTPALPVSIPLGTSSYTVTVTEAKFSPISSAFKLRIDVPDSVSAEEAAQVLRTWYDAALVDEQGRAAAASRLFSYGIPAGETNAARHLALHIESAPLETLPEKLFIAPFVRTENGNTQADMTLAVPLKSMNNEEELP